MEHGGPRKEANVSRHCPDQPQTGHRTVVENRKEAHYDRANSTMENKIEEAYKRKNTPSIRISSKNAGVEDGVRGCSPLKYDEKRRAESYRPPHLRTVGPLDVRHTWIRPEISMKASTMLMMEVNEQTIDQPGSIDAGK